MASGGRWRPDSRVGWLLLEVDRALEGLRAGPGSLKLAAPVWWPAGAASPGLWRPRTPTRVAREPPGGYCRRSTVRSRVTVGPEGRWKVTVPV